MRHGKRINHLGRTAPHRKAMLSNMAASLLVNKRINTTLAKAKALRKYVEPLITKAKTDSTHTRRVAFSYLQDKESVNALFNEVVDRVADRPGGYTRIIKLGSRLGDNAEMAMIELVDFNDLLIKEGEAKKAKSKRRRGGKSKTSETKETPSAKAKESPKGEEVIAEAEIVEEEVVADVVEAETIVKEEEVVEEVVDQIPAETEEKAVEEASEEEKEGDEETKK